MRKVFTVRVNAWTNDHYDYITGDYSGIYYMSRTDAIPELEEARREGLEAYIEETYIND